MFVMTLDQRRSRHGEDLAESLIAELSEVGGSAVVRPFQRTAGDEVQGALREAGAVLSCALQAARTDQWSIGIGIGAVRDPLPRETRAGSGEAFENARDAVTRAKRSSGAAAITAPPEEADHAEALLQLICSLEKRRSDSSQQAGELVASGLSQRAAAQRLGISQQALSQRLQSGLWKESRRVMSPLEAMMTRMDQMHPAAGTTP